MNTQLNTLIRELRAKKAMPPIDLRFYPVNSHTSSALRRHIQINADRAATQCDIWANKLSLLLRPQVPETMNLKFEELNVLLNRWELHKKCNAPCEGLKAAILLICKEITQEDQCEINEEIHTR